MQAADKAEKGRMNLRSGVRGGWAGQSGQEAGMAHPRSRGRGKLIHHGIRRSIS